MHQGAWLHQPRWLWHTMHARLLSIAMLSKARGSRAPILSRSCVSVLSNLLLLSKTGGASYGEARFLLFCGPNWKALSQTLSSDAESHENDRPRSVPLEELLAQLDEKRHSYPC